MSSSGTWRRPVGTEVCVQRLTAAGSAVIFAFRVRLVEVAIQVQAGLAVQADRPRARTATRSEQSPKFTPLVQVALPPEARSIQGRPNSTKSMRRLNRRWHLRPVGELDLVLPLLLGGVVVRRRHRLRLAPRWRRSSATSPVPAARVPTRWSVPGPRGLQLHLPVARPSAVADRNPVKLTSRMLSPVGLSSWVIAYSPSSW